MVSACAHTPPSDATGPASFDGLIGHWKGALEYVDYQPPHRTVRLPTVLEVSSDGAGGQRWVFTYDDGPGKTVVDTELLALRADTLSWGDAKKPAAEHTRFAVTRNGAQLVALTEGSDDDKPATLRETFEIHPDSFCIVKDVRSSGSTFTLRHRYDFSRTQ